MINNRQVNLWRGNQEPPTIYHIWIKDNNKLLLYDGNNWRNKPNLSQAALETLAIIAYNEPITRVQVDALRGVGSTSIIRKLVAKGFIKESGRSNMPGRPILYETTHEFLDYFGLSDIKDLPNIEDILEEVKAPDGYVTSNSKIYFDVTSSGEVKTETIKNDILSISINNKCVYLFILYTVFLFFSIVQNV